MQIQDAAKAIARRVLCAQKKRFPCANTRSVPAALILLSLLFIKSPAAFSQTQPPASDLPAQVAIPANQPIPVTLDATLSTINAKRGQIVTFLTRYSTPLGNGLEIPPQTRILGHVVDVTRAAHFGREGELRIAVDEIRLNPGGSATLTAHLDSSAMKGPGTFTNGSPHTTDMHPVAIESASGAVLGAASGARGAAVGAGTSAALAVLILKSPRGQDVYLEEGMHFAVILDQPAYLSGADLSAAQKEFNKLPRPAAPEPNSQKSGQPQLRRRTVPQP